MHPTHHDATRHLEHPQAATATAVKDPVCGMDVSADSPHRLDHAGATYAFCSADCLAKFRADANRYVAEVKRGPEVTRKGVPSQARPTPGTPVHLPDAPGGAPDGTG